MIEIKRKIQESIIKKDPIKGLLWESLQSFGLDEEKDIKPLFDRWLKNIPENDKPKIEKEEYHLNDIDEDIKFLEAGIICGDLPDFFARFLSSKKEKEDAVFTCAAYIIFGIWKATVNQVEIANEQNNAKERITIAEGQSYVPEWLKQKPTHEPCYFLIIITAEKIPTIKLPCPVDIEVSLCKKLIQESRKIKIAKSKAELEESLKELKLGDCNDVEKIKKEAGSSNVLIAFSLLAKSGVEQKTTKMEIINDIVQQEDRKPTIISIHQLQSIRGTQTFVYLN